MKKQQFTLSILLISLSLLLLQPALGQDDDDDDDHNEHQKKKEVLGCSSQGCIKCDQQQYYCVQCGNDTYLTSKGSCEDRDEYEDRGDGMSLTVGILNIIFAVVVTHGWIFHSRKHFGKVIKAQFNNDEEQTLSPKENNQQIIRIGAHSDNQTPYQHRQSLSSVVSSDQKKPLAKAEGKQIDDNISIAPTQPPQNYQIEAQQIQMAQPVYQNSSNIQQGFPIQNSQIHQNNQQNQQQGPTFVSADLNGYWLTQAGKFSFTNFSNYNRIKHVMLNLFILQSIMAMMLVMSKRRGDDADKDNRKNLLFLAFLVVMLIYFAFTLIPPIIVRILSLCFCLKNNPNGRPATVFLSVLFYVAAAILVVTTSNRLFKMDGFESQVWILLVLAGFLLVVFFDKKSVEFAKNRKGGCIDKIIRFRKMDFVNGSQPHQQEYNLQQQGQQQNQQMQQFQIQ